MVVIGGSGQIETSKTHKNPNQKTRNSMPDNVNQVKTTQDNQTVQEEVNLPNVTRDMIIAQSK